MNPTAVSPRAASHPSPSAHSSPPPKLGRPSRRTPEVVAAICQLIRTEGVSDSAAGVLAGVSTTSLSRWKQEDEDFVLGLDQARAHFEMDCLREVREARKRDGSPDWRAYAWLLERSSADGYRRPRSKQGGAAATDSSSSSSSSSSSQPSALTRDQIESIVEARLLEILGKMEAEMAGPAHRAQRAVLPEIPETPRRSEEYEPEQDDESVIGENENGAGVPEIPESPETLHSDRHEGTVTVAPIVRLSRRERRAEERRLAKEAKKLRLAA